MKMLQDRAFSCVQSSFAMPATSSSRNDPKDAYQASEALKVKFPACAANARAPRSVVRLIV